MSLFDRQFIFVQGKGGVGKTTVSRAMASFLSQKWKTLWVSMNDPTLHPGEMTSLSPQLFHLNNEGLSAFKEYAGIKIGAPTLVKIFLKNKLMKYLAQATPGLKELVLMGKIWFERQHFDRIVVDMPATGHGLTLFQSVFNWERLFKGSPLAKDAQAMIETFSQKGRVGHCIIALPEEMPLIEALELREKLNQFFDSPTIELVLNRIFPSLNTPLEASLMQNIECSTLPYSQTLIEHAYHRSTREKKNLKLWDGLSYQSIPYLLAPSPEALSQEVLERMQIQWGNS